MKTRQLSSTLLRLGLTASGCGLIRVTGAPTTGPGPVIAGASDDAAPSGDAPVPESSGDERVDKLYAETAKLTYKTVTDRELDITTLQSHYMAPMGEAYRPTPPCGNNPDPEWIKTWNADAAMANPPVAAWIQSRLNRSYAADLPAAYKAYRDQWKAFDDDLETKRKAALGLQGFYDRASALHALFEEGDKAVKALPGAERVRPGALHDVATSLANLYVEQKIGFAVRVGGGWSATHLRGAHFATLRAWGDEDVEKKQFAAYAMSGLVPSLLPELPHAGYVAPTSGGAVVNSWLRWPEDVDLAKAPDFFLKGDPALQEKKDEGRFAVPDYPHETIADLKSETKDAILHDKNAQEPKLVRLGAVVLSIEPVESRFRVTLAQRDEYTREDCVEYGPITSIGSSGTVHRQFSTCHVAEQRDTQRRFVVDVEAWPKDVDAGDWVTVFGDLEAVRTQGTVRSSTVEATVTGRYVDCFQKADPLDPKAPDYTKKLYERSHAHSEDCKLATW
jgi:hypothetical protein